MTFVVQQIEEQVDRTPDAVAVTSDEGTLSYRQLDIRANQLAHHLVAAGARRDEPVALLLERSIDVIVTELAILKLGAPYLPLDASTPQDRVRTIVRDAGVRVLVTRAAFDEPGLRIIRPDSVAIASESAARPGVDIAADNLSYVIFTSGSTGRPKGVAIPHGALSNMNAWYIAELCVSAMSRSTQLCALSFDATVFEIWPFLVAGASIHVVPDEVRADPPALVDFMTTHRISHSFLTTPLGEAVLDHPRSSELALHALLLGGDRLHRRPGPHHSFRLINIYGPTENTVVSTACDVPRTGEGLPTIGAPLTGVQAYVLDAMLERVQVGTEGELYLGAAQIARGYIGRPDLTAERFVPDPFGPPGSRMYRTGDRVRGRDDGELDFLGRTDHQVKVRGFRIELGEIEATLRQHPDVREAIVLARGESAGDKQLVAYLVGAQNQISTDALRAHLSAKLPEYMVPAVFMWLDAMPQTASGKVDRKALPEPTSAMWSSRPYDAPQTDAERTLARVWSEVLDVAQIGRQDRFFELGGHSIAAARVVSKLSTDHRVRLPLRLLLSSPTLAEAAAVIADELGRRTDAEDVPRIPKRPEALRAPLTFAQEAVWLHEQFLDNPADKSRGYMECPTLHIRGRVNPAMLERALNEIAARHEIWRTAFAMERKPTQVIQPSVRIVMTRQQRGDVAPEHRREEVERYAISLGNPFDLGKAPLVRCALVSFGDDEHYLLMLMHHLVTDGWSETLTFRELVHFYGLLVAREALPPRDELVAQFADYAAWERAGSGESNRQADQEFWRGVFANPPEPFGWKPRHASPTNQPRRVVRQVNAATATRLAALCKRENVTRAAALYATFAGVLGAHTGRDRFVMAVSNANRSPLTEQLWGLFATLIPLVVDLSGRPTLPALARQLSSSIAAALPHGSLPLSEISRMVSGSGKPRFLLEVSLSSQPTALVDTAGGCEFTQTLVHVADVLETLGLIVEERSDGSIDVCLLADPRCFDAQEAEQIIDRFEHALKAAL